MEVRCSNCGHVQAMSQEAFGGQARAEVACEACGKPFRILNPKLDTLHLETTAKKVAPVREEVSPEGRKLRLPVNKEIALKVIQGEDKGTVFPITKPRVTLGRSNADINVNDRTASRLHCAIEISDEGVELRDLGSTNGTLVDRQPVEKAALSAGSTFQIGLTVFELLVASKSP